MRDRIKALVGDVFWSDLSAHAARDAIIVVADHLDLVEAGVAVASDDTEAVGAWIAAQSIRKPSAAELARWSADPAAIFESLIVQPFVLVRPRRKMEGEAAN